MEKHDYDHLNICFLISSFYSKPDNKKHLWISDYTTGVSEVHVPPRAHTLKFILGSLGPSIMGFAVLNANGPHGQ